MSTRWYGSLNNRLEENQMFCEEIKVGTGMTEYSWSDRKPYEVVEVKDQKHISVRAMDHKKVGNVPMSNDWNVISNAKNPIIDLVKRGDFWYRAVTATIEDINSEDIERRLWLCHNGFDREKIMKNGQQTKYHKMNVSFGKAEYYYDYEF